MAVDKAKALALQVQGCTYAEIAQTLGCSEGWCKLNLKSSPTVKAAKAARPTKPLNQAHQYAEIVEKSLSNDALTHKELHAWLWSKLPPIDTASHAVYKERKEEVELQAKAVKRIIRSKTEGVIRPSWMVPIQAKYSISLMCEIADLIEMRVQEEVLYMAQMLDLPEEEANSIRYDLMRILNSKTALMQTSASTEVERLNDIADILEKRNGKAESNKFIKKIMNKVFIDENDLPY